jgi:riboflavin synthase
MFTGLIQDVGKVERAEWRGDSVELAIAPQGLDAAGLELGESIAIDGICLTVTAREVGRFRVLAGPETLARTTVAGLRPGVRVNLERALRASDRLGGHMVAGHVDGVGEIASRRQVGLAVDIQIRAPREVLRYVVEKGSIAVDGISLTVNRVDEHAFGVSLIPHTLAKTTLGDKHPGAKLNLEVDMVAKYVEKFVSMSRRDDPERHEA